MSVQDRCETGSREVAALPPQPPIARLEQTIAAAERHMELQEQRIREARLAGRDTEEDGFELRKVQLLVSILREGRERLLDGSG